MTNPARDERYWAGWTGTVVVTPPATEPVGIADLRAHARLDASTPDDALILGYIQAARRYVEAHTGRSLITQTLRAHRDAWPSRSEVGIPAGPVQTIASLTYLDQNLVEQTVPAAHYALDSARTTSRLYLRAGASWPAVALAPSGAIRLTYTAGYGAAADVPFPLRQAIMLLASHYYEQRLATGMRELVAMPFGVRELLDVEGCAWL